MRSYLSYAVAGVIALAAGSALAQQANPGSSAPGSVTTQQRTGGGLGPLDPNTGQRMTGGAEYRADSTIGSGSTMGADATMSRDINREYSESLRKGKGAEVIRRERVVEQRPVYRSTVVALEDQFPEQGSDNPSGLLSNGDWRSENENPETRISAGNPISMDEQTGQLDPQEPEPLFRRGPTLRVD